MVSTDINLDEPIHCHKCKKKTKNLDPVLVQTSNGLWRISTKCQVCKTNKSKFTKAPINETSKQTTEISQLNDKERRIESVGLHKPVRKNFPKRSIVTLGIDDLWAADLVVMSNYESDNDGYKYILNVIDTFSKFSWAEPLKKKDGRAVTNGFEKIIKKALSVNHNPPHTDKGLEFRNKEFKALLDRHNITLYHTENAEKSAIVERFNRTLNMKMRVEFEYAKSFRWLDILQKLINDYNYKDVHRTIGMTPANVDKDNKMMITQKLGNIHREGDTTPHFKVGDRVRISSVKNQFFCKYKHNWSREIFIVSEVVPTNPITYKIKDLTGEEILGSFYKQELLKTQL